MYKTKIILLALTLTCLGTSAQQVMDLTHVKQTAPKDIPLGNPGPQGRELRINSLYMSIGGKPCLPVMGELHYSRMDPAYWRDALLKMKATGINIVSTYCIWNLHEETEGHRMWSGRLDLRRFVELCKELGLLVHLRIGPYCNAEIRNGGLPDWLLNKPNLKARSNDPQYLAYAKDWYQSVYNQVKGLLYKDGGPIVGIQLENEYVTPGMIISHLTTLKKMAVQIGFDVPVYSMTHWLDSEYPKGEIIPYAGFYIETPWTAHGKEELPTGNFEFFTYNRLSDNIGTDIIHVEDNKVSLNSSANDLPFFTCEVGVGTETFYQRRAVVPKEMAGEMIILRLGCGANLMGYYMYAGGTNPVGELTTMERTGPRVSYDYQAPIRETGTMGDVMPEVKKYNYFMNDFGEQLAQQTAYLPLSCQNRDSLQWAVRSDGKSGYVFCSNYTYKHSRQAFHNVNFQVKLRDEELKMLSRPTEIKDGVYFLWPFNLDMEGITLKRATAQPICTAHEGNSTTYFFFEDDGIPAEYVFHSAGIRKLSVTGGKSTKQGNSYFVNNLQAGKDCVIEISKKDGSMIRVVTLTAKESNLLWKLKLDGRDVVILSSSALVADNNQLTVIDNLPQANVAIYSDGHFQSHILQGTLRDLQAEVTPMAPMYNAQAIKVPAHETVTRDFTLLSLSDIDQAWLRMSTSGKVICLLNDSIVNGQSAGAYKLADVTRLISRGSNSWMFKTDGNAEVCGEIEILLKNGERIVWNTDDTWTCKSNGKLVSIVPNYAKPKDYAPQEHLALYKICVPRPDEDKEETRMYITYKGDVADLYHYGRLVEDSYYDGTDWIVSVNRLHAAADVEPLILRIRGLQSADQPIYFEKNVNPADLVAPKLLDVKVRQEYRYKLDIK